MPPREILQHVNLATRSPITVTNHPIHPQHSRTRSGSIQQRSRQLRCLHHLSRVNRTRTLPDRGNTTQRLNLDTVNKPVPHVLRNPRTARELPRATLTGMIRTRTTHHRHRTITVHEEMAGTDRLIRAIHNPARTIRASSMMQHHANKITPAIKRVN